MYTFILDMYGIFYKIMTYVILSEFPNYMKIYYFMVYFFLSLFKFFYFNGHTYAIWKFQFQR